MSIYDELAQMLSAEIGQERAKAFSDRIRMTWGGQRLYFPRLSPRPSTTQTQYLTIVQIQRNFGVSKRTAYRYFKKS